MAFDAAQFLRHSIAPDRIDQFRSAEMPAAAQTPAEIGRAMGMAVFTALVQASHCSGFSCCRAQAVGTRASVLAAHGLSSCGTQALDTLRHVGSSPTRD